MKDRDRDVGITSPIISKAITLCLDYTGGKKGVEPLHFLNEEPEWPVTLF